MGGLINAKNPVSPIQLNKDNYFIGHRSGEKIIDGVGVQNSTFGYNAGMELTTWSKNVLIGQNAGGSLKAGS